MLARFSQSLSLFYMHPENQVRCSQWHPAEKQVSTHRE